MPNKNDINEEHIYLSEDLLKKSIQTLKKNKNFLLLNGNLLSTKYILSCFDVIIDNSSKVFENSNSCFFDISYNDGNIKKIFKITCLFEDASAYGFLKSNAYIDKDQLDALKNKVYNLIKDEKKVQLSSLSNDLYNEALIFVTSGINKEECKSIKDDFESKFNNYCEIYTKINENIITLIKELHDNLINSKIEV